jgi:hypothetical protein
MRKRIFFFSILLAGITGLAGHAQEQPAVIGDSATVLTKKLAIYIFPSKGQDEAQIKKDIMACYKWAKEQSDVDPFNPPKVEAQEVSTGPDGSAVKGAARGAAAGAAIGAITGNAGDGAAVGALSGAMAGRRSRVNRSRSQKAQSQQAAANKEKELINNFKKAFSACIEGKGYTVK